MLRRILVADDEQMDRQLMQESLLALDAGLDITLAHDGEEACGLLEDGAFDLVFTDLKMPRRDGLHVLAKSKEENPGAEVVIVTGHGDVGTAVTAMKRGSFDYLLKPICVDQLEVLLGKIREHRRLIEENRYLQQELAQSDGAPDIVGESTTLLDVCRRAVHVAGTDATVLLEGESGTGKELVSRLIHQSSTRRDSAFIRVNCAALSESILESELFGHEKGAFTGAHASKPGRFELAHKGTLLLDAISETSEKLQAELLRVIEEKEFERVGGTQTISVDVRIITTTNRDLAKEVREGRFRGDLYYRLNVVPIVLPPLRDRGDDVGLLARHFARKFARRLGKSCPALPDSTLALLRRYPWPGNVRELENLMQRLVIMDCDERVGTDDLPDYVRGNGHSTHNDEEVWGPTLADVERQFILRVLREADGNRTEAARRLDISTRTIRNKLNTYREEGLLAENLS